MAVRPNKSEQGLIYDWNIYQQTVQSRYNFDLELDDETLRDGLQSPSVRNPSIDDKIKILHLMDKLEIHAADLGLPASGPRAKADIARLAQEISTCKMKIRPNCAVRTLVQDIIPLIEISEQVGYPIEAAVFIGSSPIRIYAEEWTLGQMLKYTEESVEFAVKHGIPVMYVTEDTTRAHPRTIKKLYSTAINAGAYRICVCDTVGHSTPIGVFYLLRYIHKMLKDMNVKVKVDWHGHSDRGCSIPNTMSAVSTGVDRVHATALGIGERVGNTPMDLLMINLKLEGIIKHDLRRLTEYCRCVANAVGYQIPPNYPVVGSDAFKTATGVHAAAIIKAERKGDAWLADRVYSGVPAEMVGQKQNIEIGFMSGLSNVVYWLKKKGIKPDEHLVDEIFKTAKTHNRVLTEEEIMQIVKFNSGDEMHIQPGLLKNLDKEIRISKNRRTKALKEARVKSAFAKKKAKASQKLAIKPLNK
ncbi:MAG: 2-isopropylmalate synthase [candidate division Zixibacteria bacterium CG_4_9_14_3_um_filter_46_8]|nr:MAG: 2-isopropylmalate synthase [candidate division Zixibacteria bacterium CG_4_9_14_3_um_filter_46_8]